MRFKRLTSDKDPEFAKAFGLYATAFPVHEQRSLAHQRVAFAAPDYHFDVIEDDGRFVGILLYWDTPEYLYVEHFAIDAGLRGQQYGSRALAYLCGQGKPVILEIDPPVDDVAIRRQRFYEHLGFVANPYPHVHPPYRDGLSGHSLVIMSYPAAIDEALYDTFLRHLTVTVMGEFR